MKKISVSVQNRLVTDSCEAILLDKDGTLIDIHHYWGSMIKMRANYISNRWFSQSSLKEDVRLKLIEGMGVNNEGRIFPEGPVGIKPRTEIVLLVCNIIKQFYDEITEKQVEDIFRQVDIDSGKDLLPFLKILPGVASFLKVAQSFGIRMGIVTTDISSRAELSFELIGLKEYFNVIIGADQVKNPKPSADIANLALEKIKISPERAIIVGDHPIDIKTGIAANLGGAIGMLTGMSTRPDFDDLPCYVASTFEELSIKNNE